MLILSVVGLVTGAAAALNAHERALNRAPAEVPFLVARIPSWVVTPCLSAAGRLPAWYRRWL
jgi:hypothetical protein